MKLLNGNILYALALNLVLLGSCKKDEDNSVKYVVETAQTTATWKGYLKTGYFNEGTIDVTSTELTVADGKIKTGTFVLPLNTLKNTNLPDAQKPQLINHLQSHEIFNMLVFPEFVFKFTSMEPYTGGDATAVTGANFLVKGELKMMGIYKPISFPAKIVITSEKVTVAAKILVDRTRWGINYATDDTKPDADRIQNNLHLELDLSAKVK